jgi:hypothetical protein
MHCTLSVASLLDIVTPKNRHNHSNHYNYTMLNYTLLYDYHNLTL